MTINEGIKDLFTDLTSKQIITVIAIAVFIVCVAISAGSALSFLRIRALEKDVAAAKERADAFETKADQKEKEAAKYQEKITYLESNLVEIQNLARKQDDEITRLNFTVAGSRTDVDRARSVRSIASTADELCDRLKETGHPCDP